MDRKIIDTLLEHKNNLSSDTKYLSIYYPNDNFGVSEFKRRLRIFVKEYLQGKVPDLDAKKISEETVNKLNALDASLLDYGLAMFVALGHSFIAVPLPHPPKKEILFESTYKLDQLLELIDLFTNIAVITLQKDKAIFYEVEDGKLSEVSQLTNDFSAREAKEYLDKYQPTRTDQAVFGSGGRNYEASKDAVVGLFTNQVEKSFSELIKKNKPQKVFVFYSNNYLNLADDFCKSLKDQHSQMEIVCRAKNMVNVDALQKEFEKEVFESSKEIKRKLFKSSQEKYPLFAGSWQEVLPALRERKIEILFMKKGSFQEGFLWKNELYLDSQGKRTRQVNDIVPFLVEQVLSSGGSVVTLPGSMKKTPSVAARLRY